MADMDNTPTLFCTDQYILPINSSTTIGEARSCGQLWGQKHKSKHGLAGTLNVQPPIYEMGTFVTKSGPQYVSCGSDYTLEQTENTTLQQSWQCGVLLGADVRKNAASAPLKASVILYLVLLVAYIL